MSTREEEPPPTVKRAAVQAAVLRATEELLADGARFGDLAVERIARGAGISRTAFYFYFRDKRDLLRRLTEDVTTMFFAQAEVWFSGTGDAGGELRAALGAIQSAYREHAPLVRTIVETSAADAESADFWRVLVGRFVDASAARIVAEQAAGRALDVPARPTAFALVWMTERALYEQISHDTGVTDDEVLDALVRVWTRAIFP